MQQKPAQMQWIISRFDQMRFMMCISHSSITVVHRKRWQRLGKNCNKNQLFNAQIQWINSRFDQTNKQMHALHELHYFSFIRKRRQRKMQQKPARYFFPYEWFLALGNVAKLMFCSILSFKNLQDWKVNIFLSFSGER